MKLINKLIPAWSLRLKHSSLFTPVSSLAVVLLVLESATAYPQVDGCPTLTDNDFEVDRLVDWDVDPELAEPIKMAFYSDPDGSVNMLFVERGMPEQGTVGKLKLYRESTGEVTLAGLVPTDVAPAMGPGTCCEEGGVTGIVLDPNFATNGWIYLHYTVDDADDENVAYYRVARFDYDGAEIDIGSEAVIIDIPTRRGRQHSAGIMVFDSEGVMWLSVGDNFDPRKSSGCMSDLRGSILRIIPGAEGGYTVPDGNFAEHFADDFPELADVVDPAIYAKGLRNPYTMTLHPTEPWVAVGDCGPDYGGRTEEHNLIQEPGFFGYPYFAGDNTRSVSNQSADAPVDEECTGLTLPPAVPALYAYDWQSCAMTGPIYSYDRLNPHPGQIPPHFHGKWLISDIHWSEMRLLTLNDQGDEILNEDEDIFNDLQLNRAIDFKIGSDGGLYALNYATVKATSASTSIYRLRYTGPEITEECMDAAGVPEIVSVDKQNKNNRAINIQGSKLKIAVNHAYRLSVIATAGRTVLVEQGSGPGTHDFTGRLAPGVYQVQVEFNGGGTFRSLVSILP